MPKPEDKNLEAALGKNYSRYMEFEKTVNAQNIVLEWHYYSDAKSWLCKVLHKKKNLCWLSVWNTGFRLTFYFPERTMDSFYELDIGDEIKTKAKETKPTGKSHPVLLLIKNNNIMKDALKLLEYKRALK